MGFESIYKFGRGGHLVRVEDEIKIYINDFYFFIFIKIADDKNQKQSKKQEYFSDDRNNSLRRQKLNQNVMF